MSPLRPLRALALFAFVFASYGLWWLRHRKKPEELRRLRLDRYHRVNANRLAHGFSELGGVFIKLGQVLSVLGTFLPRTYADALARLQDRVPPRPFREVEQRLCEALGPEPLSHFAEFDMNALAAASLAQVHRARTSSGVQVAVKVLYPGIEQIIRQDLFVLRAVLPVVRRLLPVHHLERAFDQLEEMLRRETDYERERNNMRTLQRVFADRDDIVVPEPIDELSYRSVIAMTFEPGIRIGDAEALEGSGIAPPAVARLLLDAYFKMVFEHGVVHADPHPGNFFVRPGPTLVILDYGAVESIRPDLISGMKTVITGAMTRDDEQILKGVAAMGFVAPDGDRELLKRVGKEYLNTLAGLSLGDVSRFERETLEKLTGYQHAKGRLRDIMRSIEYPEGYFYLERALVLLFGLVVRLAPNAELSTLALPYVSRMFAVDRIRQAQANKAP